MAPGTSVLPAPRASWLARVRGLLRRPAAAAVSASRLDDPLPSRPTASSGFGPSLFEPVGPLELDDARRSAYLAWLLAAPPAPSRPDATGPARILAALDAELSSREGCARLLRRAPNVVPRLMEALRSEAYSSFEIAGHIQKDVVLTAEVMRRARSCLYSHYMQRRPTVAQAVDLLGSAGLNDVIARVLFRPMFNAPAGTRAFVAGHRVMEDAYRCAVLMVVHAEGLQADPVDAHLAGLLQCAGWGAVLRALEVHRVLDHLHAGALEAGGFAAALFERRDRMLGQLLLAWQVSPALSAMAASLGGPDGPSPLALGLAQVQAHVIAGRLHALAPPAPACAPAVAGRHEIAPG